MTDDHGRENPSKELRTGNVAEETCSVANHLQYHHINTLTFTSLPSALETMAGPSRRRRHHVDSSSSESIAAHSPESGVKPAKHHRSRNLTVSRVMRFCLPRPTDRRSRTTNRLPLFGNLRPYAGDNASWLQERLWELEVRRFIQVVNGTEDMLVPVLKLDSDEIIHYSLTRQNSKKLQVLADRIRAALHVCVIDDSLLLERLPDNTRPSKRFSESYWALRQAWGEEDDLPGRRQRSDPDDISYQEYKAKRRGDTAEDQHRNLDDFELEQCYYLVDQVTATLVLLAVRGRDNDYWLVVVLACLAKLSTKIKFLVREFSKNVAICFRNSKDHQDTLGPEHFRDDDAQQPLNDNSPTHTRYRREVEVVSGWLTDCFIRVLRGLGAQNPRSARSGSVDICTIVYPAGIAGTRTLLCQARNGEVSGSPGLIPVAFASNSITIIDKLSSILSSRAHIPPPGDQATDETMSDRSKSASKGSDEPETVLVVELERHNEDVDGEQRFNHVRRRLTIRTLFDFVAIATCLSLCHPEVGIGFQSSLQTISALSAFEEPEDHEYASTKSAAPTRSDVPTEHTPSTKSGTAFYAFVNLWADNAEGGRPTDTLSSLSNSVIAARRHNVLDRQLPPLNHARVGTSATRNPREVIAALNEAQEKRKRLENIIRKWKIHESSIVVECPDFVVRVSLFSAALVLGGLACGFFVGERITGVDPFNLTMFSWIIAGFVILIAKSVRVSDWTWRDFLFRQVTCRTVKEVADVVPGLDEQDILCFLLSSEIRSTLKTRGPFGGVFYFSPTDGGFSIDVKPNLQTLWAAGVIPVMVQTLEGPVLRFLRLVSGYNGHTSVEMSGQCVDCVCKNPPDNAFDVTSPEEGQIDEAVVLFERISWMKILGVYNVTGVSFR
ncbi:hypothetical protein CH63R_01452 [Colletotrichum higginsianum IMI 349063]|uniref:Uncharacterized protein n=1 Tax=Colletotrichum higginsianum (strain IMI 349063) TaxID=759273 RepID=A0A1B7YWD7_COLHI|nr:hypothetical protein CH63R_01452 [Colletotrichum higginsianum IMI 349063]OBR16272.1 hypothetical protein CH63R_01452 [Colletotrichum higginsianum IMI 349063]